MKGAQQLLHNIALRTGIFPAISVIKMAQSPVIAATKDSKLVSPEGTQQGKNTCHLPAIRLQPLSMVSSEETQDVKTLGHWPQTAELPVKGMISVDPDSCISLYIDKH